MSSFGVWSRFVLGTRRPDQTTLMRRPNRWLPTSLSNQVTIGLFLVVAVNGSSSQGHMRPMAVTSASCIVSLLIWMMMVVEDRCVECGVGIPPGFAVVCCCRMLKPCTCTFLPAKKTYAFVAICFCVSVRSLYFLASFSISPPHWASIFFLVLLCSCCILFYCCNENLARRITVLHLFIYVLF